MLFLIFIAQVMCSVRKSSSIKDSDLGQQGKSWHSMVCNLRIACTMLDGGEEVEREGKRMGKSEETQDVQEAAAE